MKTINHGSLLVTIGLLISACSASASADPTTPAGSSPAPPTAATTEVSATAQPPLGPTATVWPPVFDPLALGDIRDLNSFIVTINEKNTFNGQLTERTITIGYIQEPLSAYRVNEYSSGVDKTYEVGSRTYVLTGTGDWYLSAGTSEDVFAEADIPDGNTYGLEDAQFTGEEDYQGIAAYHFVLEPTTPAGTNYTKEGDFFLSKEGSYVLYSHWKETSPSQVIEVTEALSSINELTEITLPSEMSEMPTALDLPGELGLPLPADSVISSMVRYTSVPGVDFYYFNTKISAEEFLDYYRDLEPTDGWAVSQADDVTLHGYECRVCVIINKGSTQVALIYDGSTIKAEFDR